MAMTRAAVTQVRVRSVDGARVLDRPDKLVTEEPMEIRVHGPGQDASPLAVTMRTPGSDFELAVGFCVTEGVLAAPAELESVAYCLEPGAEQEFNVVTVALRRPVELGGHERHFVANASCGLCGKTTIEQLDARCDAVADGPVVARSVLVTLPSRLRDVQSVFDATGGLHAAGCFDATGELLVAREDVGRHNALDKLVGRAFLDGSLPLASAVLVVSGRVSFEIVQKAAIAGVPIVCAVSAPSSLAVQAAGRFGQTLVGFLRGDRCNVYTRPDRIDLTA